MVIKMSKSKITKEIETQLIKQRPMRGYYAAKEVTITSNWLSHKMNQHCFDRADVVEWDGTEHFTCYEIKISKSDANSKAMISMFGDRNYLVAPLELATDIAQHSADYNFDGRLGVMAYIPSNQSFQIIRKCTVQKSIKIGDKIQVLEGFAKAASRDFIKPDVRIDER